jgi:hypothetical protein
MERQSKRTTWFDKCYDEAWQEQAGEAQSGSEQTSAIGPSWWRDTRQGTTPCSISWARRRRVGAAHGVVGTQVLGTN